MNRYRPSADLRQLTGSHSRPEPAAARSPTNALLLAYAFLVVVGIIIGAIVYESRKAAAVEIRIEPFPTPSDGCAVRLLNRCVLREDSV